MSMKRDYDRVVAGLRPQGTREERMQRVVDALWDELGSKGCSWIGFYLKSEGADEMVLGPRRDKPACSPIGLHGACGRAFLSKRALVVTDVANLHAGYIACDPRDRSEAVIPCMDAYDDRCWGVLDADSFDLRGFDEADVMGMTRVLVHMGLHVAQEHAIEVV
jgi:putative methionine-R-sulfoxide reductase with GAF domain